MPGCRSTAVAARPTQAFRLSTSVGTGKRRYGDYDRRLLGLESDWSCRRNHALYHTGAYTEFRPILRTPSLGPQLQYSLNQADEYPSVRTKQRRAQLGCDAVLRYDRDDPAHRRAGRIFAH